MTRSRHTRAALLLVLCGASFAGCASRHRESASAGALGSSLSQAPPDAVVVDKIVAFVIGRPITLSEVELEARIARAADGQGEAALEPIPPEENAAALRHLLDRVALRKALGSQFPDMVDPRAADQELDRLRKSFPSRERWQRFLDRLELTEDEVRERRRRTLDARAIVEAKLVAMVRIKGEAITAYMAEHPDVTDREEARRLVMVEISNGVRAEIIAEARRATSARVVDPLQPEAPTVRGEIP